MAEADRRELIEGVRREQGLAPAPAASSSIQFRHRPDDAPLTVIDELETDAEERRN